MKRQMKIAAVVSATALLAIGASFTSMAAAKTGTWKLEDEGWVCYDKDGDVYENVFCLDGGKEYYVGDDGVLVTNDWVEDEDGSVYYVGSTGAKTINAWREIVPEDGEEDDDVEWFYFGSKGAKSKGKKVIDGKTYYFDTDGIMLTGWVEYDSVAKVAEPAGAYAPETFGNVVYTDENGARVASTWVNTYELGLAEEDQEEADTYWYWIKSSGKPQTSRNLDINGGTYFFGADGKMLSGWVVGNDVDGNGKDETFFETTAANAFELGNIYYCGSDDQGWAKKNTWIKTWNPAGSVDKDADVDQYWYWIGKDGVVYKAAATASSANAVDFVNGEFDAAVRFDETPAGLIAMKEINNKTYAFNENGEMFSGLVKKGTDDVYYFGGADDGAMKTGVVTLTDADDYEYKFFFGESTKNSFKKGVAVTGNANGRLYIDGQLRTGDNKYQEVQVGSVYYMIDDDGDVRTSKKVYKDADENEFDLKNVTFDTSKTPLKGSYTK